MKTRSGFVSNSSSSSFIITNLTKKTLPLSAFVKENPQLVKEFNERYRYDFTQEEMLESAEAIGVKLTPGEGEYIFGDEQGTTVGHVFDYILRDGGSSKRFSWRFHQYHR
jgi:hypothetical protein